MITYSGIVSYFKDFANKHTQINSFSFGELEQLETKKINEYPILHILVTGTTIEDNTISYDVDAYILTGINEGRSDESEWREDSLASTLLIMQDLRSEFFKGKYIVNPQLLLQGSESISCTPIDESFNNRVFGWSTSITVEGVNESTQCNIPYVPTEIFDGLEFTAPVNNLSKLQWFSATEAVQSKATTGQYSGATTITGLAPFISTDAFHTGNSILARQGANVIHYDYNKNGFTFDVSNNYAFSNIYMRWKGTSDRFHTSFFGLKVSHIKDENKGSKYTELLWLANTYNTTATKGFRIMIGSSFTTVTAHRKKLLLYDIRDDSFTVIGDVSDESTDYLREESLTITIRAAGQSGSPTNRVYVHLEGQGQGTYIDAELEDNAPYYLGVGGQLPLSGYNNLSNFIFKELVMNDSQGTDQTTFPNQTELYRWLKHR